MPHSNVVMAWWSPIDKPVRGSPLRGASIKSLMLILVNAFKRSLPVFAMFNSSNALRKPSPNAIGASEVVSTPPATPTSI